MPEDIPGPETEAGKGSQPGLSREQRINLETAKIGWQELQRYFAMGALIVVAGEMDLVSITSAFIDDDSDRIQSLMTEGYIRKADTGDARRWNLGNTEFWAVVAVPWVLVQEID